MDNIRVPSLTSSIKTENLENKTAHYMEIADSQHLILCPGSQKRIHCHIAKLELNWRV
jgi:hypothetical protein